MASNKPFNKTILGISLIHGRLRALPVVKGQTMGNWEYPGIVETTEQLRSALHDAIRETNFTGKYVSWLVEDFRMVHQYHLVPPMAGADLDRYLDRMVNQDNPSGEPLTWRHRKAVKGRERSGLLLDVWPQSLVAEIIQVSQDHGLIPLHLFPLASVFVDQVRFLAAEPTDVLLLVTQAAGKVVFVIARGDGTPLFDRYLSAQHDDVRDPERISGEIIRSILFAKQQLGQQVSQVWVMGETDRLSAEVLQPFVDIPILQSPMTPDPAYWIWVGMNLSPSHASNFVPNEVRTASSRKMMAKVTVAVMAGFVCLSVSTSGLVEGLVARDQDLKKTITVQTQSLQQTKQAWESRHQALDAQRQWVQQIEVLDQPPVVGWFLSAIPNMVPDELVLTKVSVDQTDQQWRIELQGHAPKDFRVSSVKLAELEQQLQDSAFQIQISRSWQDSWLKELRQGSQPSGRNGHQSWLIEGVMG
jgi:hypothetical protein